MRAPHQSGSALHFELRDAALQAIHETWLVILEMAFEVTFAGLWFDV